MINVLAVGKSDYQGNLDLCLTSRALGASEITFIGRKDPRLVRSINTINRNWGGKFRVSFVKSYDEIMSNSKKSIKIYLTRYGAPLQGKSQTIRTYKSIILIVTLKDNVKQIHDTSDFNISVSSQPHSSSGAVAIFLHEYYKGRELAMHFENARYKLVPK